MSAWLNVPLADYEGHMSAPQVAQLATLADLFAAALEAHRPEAVAIVGIAGGNGLESAGGNVKRIGGFDVHAEYLAETARRFAHLPLELTQADLAQTRVAADPYDLVHAALVFEHAGTGLCLENTLALVKPAGVLSVVLQLASTLSSNEAAAVAPTGFASLQSLAPHFRLIEPAWLTTELSARGWQRLSAEHHPVASGKSFWHAYFQRIH
jgi:hypothetical protein